jgi:hypothetical protein
MLTVRGIYDGKNVTIIDKIKGKKKFKVIVTFIEELHISDQDIRDFSAQTSGLDFWEDPREDIYQDLLIQKP